MARQRTSDPLPTAPQGFVASAVRLPNVSRNKAGRAESWQSQAWTYWESVAELRYVSTWIGNVLSRARLVPAHREGRMLVPITDGRHPAAEAVDALYGGPQGQAAMLQAYGEHTTIAGEVYLVWRAEGDTWDMLANGKVTQQNGQLRADFGTEGGSKVLSGNDLVVRLWTPNPRDPTRADSPVRSNLNTLAQIVGYDAHINAQIRSRLAGNGILFLSSEVDFPAPPGADPQASPATNFMAMLGEAMMTPIGDPSDPSALVPIVAMVPTESLGKNEHVKFWSDLDDAVVSMRDAAIKRLALGMDVPPEVLLGVADTNHWNAWLSEESAVKAHLEPRLATLAYGLTEQYLQPSLTDLVDDPEDFFIIADTSSIRLRPNRSAEAIELYDRGELSSTALLRETGFQPEDAPEDEERRFWLLRKIATGSTSPEQTAAALAELGIDAPAEGGTENRGVADHMRTDTAAELVTRNTPSFDAARDRARSEPAIAACGVLVFRALERAGNRLRNLHPRTDTSHIPAVDLYQHVTGDPDALLAGAWDCAPDVLSPYTDDVVSIVTTLDFYVRGLLSSHRPHSSVVLGALIATRPPALEPSL
jgi:hypothetical protein